LARDIAEKSNGLYTQAQVEDQMRIMGMCVNGGCVSPGVGEELNGRTPTDPGARWISTGLTNADGNSLVIQALPDANPALQAYIMANYNSATPGQVPSQFTYQPSPTQVDWSAVRNTAADMAGTISTNAGRIGATAGAAVAIPGLHQPGAVTVATGAAVASLTAEAVAQILRPDPIGMFKDNFLIGIPARALSVRFPVLGPIVNEMAEKIKVEAKK